MAKLRTPIGSTVVTGDLKFLKSKRVLDLTDLIDAFCLLSMLSGEGIALNNHKKSKSTFPMSQKGAITTAFQPDSGTECSRTDQI